MAPQRDDSAYKAAVLIYSSGTSQMAGSLVARIECDGNQEQRAAALEQAIRTGWLRRLDDGRIALTDFALEHFETAPTRKFVGQVAAPRVVDIMNRKPYKTPARLGRTDAPDCSVRTMPSHYGKAEA
jgi:hypothetical protein